VKPSASEDPMFAPPALHARAAIVNRTHRVVRERAQAMQARKRRVWDLVIPFLICSAVLWIIVHAILSVADHSTAGVEEGLWQHVKDLGSDAGNNISLLLLWFVPLTVITAAIVLLRRSRASQRDDEVRR